MDDSCIRVNILTRILSLRRLRRGAKAATAAPAGPRGPIQVAPRPAKFRARLLPDPAPALILPDPARRGARAGRRGARLSCDWWLAAVGSCRAGGRASGAGAAALWGHRAPRNGAKRRETARRPPRHGVRRRASLARRRSKGASCCARWSGGSFLLVGVADAIAVIVVVGDVGNAIVVVIGILHGQGYELLKQNLMLRSLTLSSDTPSPSASATSAVSGTPSPSSSLSSVSGTPSLSSSVSLTSGVPSLSLSGSSHFPTLSLGQELPA